MALKRNETYPGRFGNPTSDHPQGAFKNRSAPGAQDGSFCEQQWANDWDGFFGRLLTVAGITPNGNADTALASQYYDALTSIFIAGTVPISKGGTGATTVSGARTNLELKSAALLDVATNADMQAGTATDKLPSVAAVTSLFSKRSFSTNDSIRIPDVPGGLLIQWGEASTSPSGFRVNFPKAFPNACIGIVVSDRNSFSAVGTAARDLTGFSLQSSTNGTTLSFFIAIGF